MSKYTKVIASIYNNLFSLIFRHIIFQNTIVMDDIKLEDYFNVVIEPEHSKKVLLGLQKKYGYDSVRLYKEHKQDNEFYKYLDIEESDYHSWIHHFIIFTQNDGNIAELGEGEWDLKLDENDWGVTNDQFEEIDKQGEVMEKNP